MPSRKRTAATSIEPVLKRVQSLSAHYEQAAAAAAVAAESADADDADADGASADGGGAVKRLENACHAHALVVAAKRLRRAFLPRWDQLPVEVLVYMFRTQFVGPRTRRALRLVCRHFDACVRSTLYHGSTQSYLMSKLLMCCNPTTGVFAHLRTLDVLHRARARSLCLDKLMLALPSLRHLCMERFVFSRGFDAFESLHLDELRYGCALPDSPIAAGLVRCSFRRVIVDTIESFVTDRGGLSHLILQLNIALAITGPQHRRVGSFALLLGINHWRPHSSNSLDMHPDEVSGCFDELMVLTKWSNSHCSIGGDCLVCDIERCYWLQAGVNKVHVDCIDEMLQWKRLVQTQPPPMNGARVDLHVFEHSTTLRPTIRLRALRGEGDAECSKIVVKAVREANACGVRAMRFHAHRQWPTSISPYTFPTTLPLLPTRK